MALQRQNQSSKRSRNHQIRSTCAENAVDAIFMSRACHAGAEEFAACANSRRAPCAVVMSSSFLGSGQIWSSVIFWTLCQLLCMPIVISSHLILVLWTCCVLCRPPICRHITSHLICLVLPCQVGDCHVGVTANEGKPWKTSNLRSQWPICAKMMNLPPDFRANRPQRLRTWELFPND